MCICIYIYIYIHKYNIYNDAIHIYIYIYTYYNSQENRLTCAPEGPRRARPPCRSARRARGARGRRAAPHIFSVIIISFFMFTLFMFISYLYLSLYIYIYIYIYIYAYTTVLTMICLNIYYDKFLKAGGAPLSARGPDKRASKHCMRNFTRLANYLK